MRKNLFIGDNLPVLRNMQSESVDLIYLDPPFNSGKQWGNPIKAEGRKAEVAFKDTWSLGDIHADEELELFHYAKDAIPLINSLHKINGGSWRAYLIYMGVRLAEMRRILKESGTIYYHCDPVMSHGVKLLMDSIFGKGNFRNEIIWCYSGGGVSKQDFPRKHDVILRYTKYKNWIHNVEYKPYKENTQQVGKHSTYSGGQDIDLERGTPITDWWTDIKTATGWSKERTGYPTQKPLALLERIIRASSNNGDVVLDPFCGCATACIAAERLRRQWIGIDLSEKAEYFIRDRITKESLGLIEGVYEVNPKQERRTDLEKLDKNAVKNNLYAKDKTCAGCQKKKDLEDMDLDHIVAKTRGGQDEWRNFQLLCRQCNTSKGGKGMTEWRSDLMQRRIDEFAKLQVLNDQKWLAQQQAKRRVQK